MRQPISDHEWTLRKLAVVKRYFNSYNTALSGQPFRREYIDAFAGTGYCDVRSQLRGDGQPSLGFHDPQDADAQALLDGSARIALQASPGFHRHIFIERNAARCTQLQKLKTEFPHLAGQIDIQHGDANERIRQLCARNWRYRRAVLFLDPFGMQVEWGTIEAIAATKAIDLWWLFPLGVVGRIMPLDGDIPPEWQAPLTMNFGTDGWRQHLYKANPQLDLFGERVERVDLETIGGYLLDRLRTVFAGVSDKPLVLRNSKESPMYLLCFAAGNPRGAKIAVRIANYLLRDAA